MRPNALGMPLDKVPKRFTQAKDHFRNEHNNGDQEEETGCVVPSAAVHAGTMNLPEFLRTCQGVPLSPKGIHSSAQGCGEAATLGNQKPRFIPEGDE